VVTVPCRDHLRSGAVARPGGSYWQRSPAHHFEDSFPAGGAARIAKLDHAVPSPKRRAGQTSETEVDLKKILQRESEDLQLRPSDILYVPNSRTKQVILRAAEIGLAVGTGVALYHLAYQ
jgi:hypothetical protein